jgi:phosphinothricin acetyltransferase
MVSVSWDSAAVFIRNCLSLLKEKGIHAAIGGIALPNDASVALHEKFGMRKVAHFEQVGFKFGKWVDVGYWERFL